MGELVNLPDKEIGPWDLAAADVMNRHDVPLEIARDTVISSWLINFGDTRPFCDWVLNCQHTPSFKVVEAFAAFMNPDTVVERELPFFLTAKWHRQGRPRNPESIVRDEYLAWNVKTLVDSGTGYDAAIESVRDLVGGGVGLQTIRDAYDKRHGQTACHGKK